LRRFEVVKIAVPSSVRNRQRGSGLLIALLALALLGAGLVATLRYVQPAAEFNRQTHVSAEMSAQVQRAIWAYVARNYRLPCPADGTISQLTGSGYGVEQNAGSGTCSASVTGSNAAKGIVPWVTLGIDKSLAQDAWGHMIGYAVTGALTSTTSTPYKSKTLAALTSTDAQQVTLSGVTSNQAYVLLSFGPEGGSYSTGGTQTAVQSNGAYSQTVLQQEANNRLPASFAGSPFDANVAKTGAVGGQWLVYENSSSLCGHLNGHAGTQYCNGNQSPPPTNGTGSAPGGSFTQPAAGAATLLSNLQVTTSAGSSNPNGINSNAVLVKAGQPVPVLVLGTNTSSPSIGGAPTQNGSSQSCAWIDSPLLLTTGTLRAYFEFSTVGNGQGDGFTMAFLPAATSFANGTPCGGTPGGQGTPGGSGNLNQGSYLGFEAITDGGTTGTATATGARTNGKLSAVAVNAGGAGYLWAPPVEVTGSTNNEGSAYVSQMNVSGIVVTYPGVGYIAAKDLSPAPAVTIAPAGGANYKANPLVTIETATSTGCTANCANASGTAQINSSGQVIGLTVTPGMAGSGYKRAPAVTLASAASTGCSTGCADAIGASATINGSTGAVSGLFISSDTCVQNSTCGTAKVSGMDIRTVVLDNPGSGYLVAQNFGGLGYTSNPSVFINPVAPGNSGGSGASATAIATNGSVAAIALTASGHYSTSNIVITIAGGGIAYATIQNINAGQVSDVQLQNAGGGYPANTTVVFSLPAPLNCTTGCVAATAVANTDNQGHITGISIWNGGSGYATAYDKGNWTPVTDTTHVPATAVAVVSNGQITAIEEAGVNVTVVPSANETKTPTAATITPTIGANGAITGLTLTSFGSGYNYVPTIKFTGPTNCAQGCTTATAHVQAMGVDTVSVSNTANEPFTALASIGIDPPITTGATPCSGSCFPATAAANMTVVAITPSNAGSGYTSAPAISLPPPLVLPKLALEFRTYHYPNDPDYSDYGYHDDWGYLGSVTAAYAAGTKISSALVSATATQEGGAYRTLANYSLPTAYPGTQGFNSNIRHDDNVNCSGVATSNCVPEYVGLLVVDALHHDTTYHYSTNTANYGLDNTAYTVSPSCDSAAGNNAALHEGGFVAGGASTGGALASPSTPNAGGCTYDTVAQTNIVTNSGPITDTQDATNVAYHPVRVEIRRYCNSSCSSCGNIGTQGDSYMQVAAYMDCDSAALGGRACSDLSQNILVAGSQVFSVAVTNGGSGYTSAPSVGLSGVGTGATATATIAGGKVTAVTITAPGSGYTAAPAVSFTGGGGTGAAATASLSGLPLQASYSGGHVYAINYCSVDPGATNWTSSQRGLSSLDQVIAGFTVGAGSATRGVLIRNVLVGTYN